MNRGKSGGNELKKWQNTWWWWCCPQGRIADPYEMFDVLEDKIKSCLGLAQTSYVIEWQWANMRLLLLIL